MKKFVKYGTIFGCVLVLGGAGIASAAFALGSDPVRIWEFVEEKFDDPDRYYYEDIVGTVAMTIVPAEDTENGGALHDLENEWGSGYNRVTELDITIESGIVRVYRDDEAGELTVFSENGRMENLRYGNMERYQKLEVYADEGEEYRIAIPKDWVLDSVEVETRGGVFIGEDIRANETEFSTVGGEIQVFQMEGKYTTLECENGTIVWNGDGEVSRTVDIEASVGGMVEVSLHDIPEPEAVGYDMEYDNSVIDFFGVIREGRGSENRNAMNGMAHLELDADDGSTIIVH